MATTASSSSSSSSSSLSSSPCRRRPPQSSSASSHTLVILVFLLSSLLVVARAGRIVVDGQIFDNKIRLCEWCEATIIDQLDIVVAPTPLCRGERDRRLPDTSNTTSTSSSSSSSSSSRAVFLVVDRATPCPISERAEFIAGHFDGLIVVSPNTFEIATPVLLELGSAVDDGVARAPAYYVTVDVGEALKRYASSSSSSSSSSSISISLDADDVAEAHGWAALAFVCGVVSAVVGVFAAAALGYAVCVGRRRASWRTTISLVIAFGVQALQAATIFLDPWHARATTSRLAFDLLYGLDSTFILAGVLLLLLTWGEFLLASEGPGVRARWSRFLVGVSATIFGVEIVASVIRVYLIASRDDEVVAFRVWSWIAASYAAAWGASLAIVVVRFRKSLLRGRGRDAKAQTPSANEPAAVREVLMTNILVMTSNYLFFILAIGTLLFGHMFVWCVAPAVYGPATFLHLQWIWRTPVTLSDVASILFWLVLIQRRGELLARSVDPRATAVADGDESSFYGKGDETSSSSSSSSSTSSFISLSGTDSVSPHSSQLDECTSDGGRELDDCTSGEGQETEAKE